MPVIPNVLMLVLSPLRLLLPSTAACAAPYAPGNARKSKYGELQIFISMYEFFLMSSSQEVMNLSTFSM